MVASGSRPSYLKPLAIVGVVIVSLIAILLSTHKSIEAGASRLKDSVCERNTTEYPHYNGKTRWSLSEKPKDKKVVALLFVGREQYVSILECYIRRNLVVNGGWVDHAIWVMNTINQDDLDFMADTIRATPQYYSHIVTNFQWSYDIVEPDTIYVKIDDDVVFIEDHAIPTIVHRLHTNPQYSAVSANVMNSPALAFVHFHLGAIRPYLPEKSALYDRNDLTIYDPLPAPADWRLSGNPYWYDPAQEQTDLMRNETREWWKTFEDYKFHSNHRWLRLPDDFDVVDTPFMELTEGAEYAAFGKAWGSWALTAQQHYSFLENLEKNELWRYKFDVWNYYFERLPINFLAFDGQTVIDHPLPNGDDEKYMSMDLPEMLNRPAVLDGSAMVVHFSFSSQILGMSKTDLLARYAAYAKENICGRAWGT